MIAEIERFQRSARKLATFAVIVVAFLINKYFDWSPNHSLIEAMAYVALALFGVILEGLADSITDRLPFLRKLILKKNFIEGSWFSVIRSGGSVGEIVSYGFEFFEYKDGTYRVNGYGYYPDSENWQQWRSVFSRYSDGVFEYCFSYSVQSGLVFTSYCRYQFLLTGQGIPDTYTGEYLDPTTGNVYVVHGRKIWRRELVDKANSTLERRALIPVLHKELFDS